MNPSILPLRKRRCKSLSNSTPYPIPCPTINRNRSKSLTQPDTLAVPKPVIKLKRYMRRKLSSSQTLADRKNQLVILKAKNDEDRANNMPRFISLTEWINVNELLLQDLYPLSLQDKRGNLADIISPANLTFLKQFDILDKIYENRTGQFYMNYHWAIHGELTIYQKIHDPLFRNLASYKEYNHFYNLDTLNLLNVARMKIVRDYRNADDQLKYEKLMKYFLSEPLAREKIEVLATLDLTNPEIKAPLVFLCVCARVLLLSVVDKYDQIITLVENFEEIYG